MTRKLAIKVPMLARVEGEGALEINIRDNKIKKLQLQIYEPPRLFEKLLVDRSCDEVLDTVARICGICPVAYQMSAVQALEQAFHYQPNDEIGMLRRLFYCGEWMESHGLHIHLLAAPDFLGYQSALEMAKYHPDVLERGLKLQNLGNQIVALFGARSVHPVGACIGGFYKAPTDSAIATLKQSLETALPLAKSLVTWAASLDLPDYNHPFTYVALTHPHEYPMNEGMISTSNGLSITKEAYQTHFIETQTPHSTALHAHLDGKPYLVGPLARLNLNYTRLPAHIRNFAAQAGCVFPSHNMFHSIIARAIEVYYCCDEALRILNDYEGRQPICDKYTIQAGIGFGATEAPRGLLWHRYEIDPKGLIKAACIIPPTSQNQARIEEDLKQTLNAHGLDQDEAAIKQLAEKVIRNYDPCISCSTHFLDLTLSRQ